MTSPNWRLRPSWDCLFWCLFKTFFQVGFYFWNWIVVFSCDFMFATVRYCSLSDAIPVSAYPFIASYKLRFFWIFFYKSNRLLRTEKGLARFYTSHNAFVKRLPFCCAIRRKICHTDVKNMPHGCYPSLLVHYMQHNYQW